MNDCTFEPQTEEIKVTVIKVIRRIITLYIKYSDFLKEGTLEWYKQQNNRALALWFINGNKLLARTSVLIQ